MTQKNQPLTKNAASTSQRRNAEHVENRRAEFDRHIWATQMSTPEGRAFVSMVVIGKGRILESCWDPHGSLQSYKIGRQDIGKEIYAEAAISSPKEFLLMEAERRARLDAEQAAIDASHVQRSDAANEGNQ